MNIFLVLAFLFFVGAIIGWIFEFLFRNLISHSGPRNKYFINPGFCKGPYLPIYGVGLCVMFIITYYVKMYFSDISTIMIIIFIGFLMTFIEFVGGIILLKFMNLRLWDYRDNRFNVMGLICPMFSFIWTFIGSIYFLFIHPYAIDGIVWLSNNLAFSFFVGLFFGLFIIDLFLSIKDAITIKKYGDENSVIIKLEEFKAHLNKKREEAKQKVVFFNQLKYENHNIKELLNELEHYKEEKIDNCIKKKSSHKKL